MGWFDKKYTQNDLDTIVTNTIEKLNATDSGFRERINGVLSGSNYTGDTMHQISVDFGYPDTLDFSHFYNMYRRFGIARNIVTLPVDISWIDNPEVEGSAAFVKDLNTLIKDKNLWFRLAGLDTRQRVGRYAGALMIVRDGKTLNMPIYKLNGIGSLVKIVPLYESQLKVLETQNDVMKDDYGMPTMYQYSATVGNRNEHTASSISIHPSRLVIASEGADDGSIYGISALEAPYNSLMDLRKIIGASAEGFYKNAAQSIVFDLNDAATAKINQTLLDKFNENVDDFMRNRSRRSLWTPGMKANVLTSTLTSPVDAFNSALNDTAAASKIPATILIGQQTGRLASGEDSKQFLSTLQSRRVNFQSEMVRNVLDWFIKYGVLPSSEYEIEWSDLMAANDEQKLANSQSMAAINESLFKSGGGLAFTGEEIREAAGYETDKLTEGEDLPETEYE